MVYGTARPFSRKAMKVAFLPSAFYAAFTERAKAARPSSEGFIFSATLAVRLCVPPSVTATAFAAVAFAAAVPLPPLFPMTKRASGAAVTQNRYFAASVLQATAKTVANAAERAPPWQLPSFVVQLSSHSHRCSKLSSACGRSVSIGNVGL